MPDELVGGYVACDGCGRVLRTEDGPTCPECRAQERREAREAARREGARAERAAGADAPDKAGEKGKG